MLQPDLFTDAVPARLSVPLDPPRARRRDPDTSTAAAAAAGDLQRDHQRRILACLRASGPGGKDGIARRTGIDGVAVARRMAELERQRTVRLTGRKVPSDTGRLEREWEAT